MKQVTIKIDPNDHHIPKGATAARLLNACGILPAWGLTSIANELSMKDNCLKEYQYGGGPMSGGTVDADGVHTYPEDPDQYPIMSLTNGEETMYIYQHAVVAFVKKDDIYITRMD